MKKKLLLTMCTVAFSVLFVAAQNDKDKDKKSNDNSRNSSGLALSIGGSAVYYYGPGDRNFDKYEDERLNWQLNGMLGITIARDAGGRRTMLAAFGNYGFNNRSTITQIFKDQGYTTLALEQSGNNNFYQYEAGVLISEILRLSTGLGQQNFNEQALVSADGIKLNAAHLEYYSSTAGLNLNLGPVAWTINCNFAYGKDFKKTVLTPSTGLMLRF